VNFSFNNCSITGMLAVLPNKEVFYKDEINNFPFSEKSSLQLAKIMGFNSRRIIDEGYTAADLCVHGLNYLIDQKLLNKNEINAVVFVSQSPDHIQPPTSNIIQGKLGLSYDTVCIDINQGCSGFITGLFECFCLLNAIGNDGKIILLNAETSSFKVSKRDRSTAPLFGDAAVITIIEKTPENKTIRLKIKNDGSRYDAIIIPAGGFRLRSNEKTCIEELQGDGNYRSKQNLLMKGDDVFSFTINEVVDLINEMISESYLSKDEIDYFMLHQPNQFMVNKIINKMGLKEEKAPSNIQSMFGNSSGASLPFNIVYNLGKILEERTLKLILSGFGTGLSWNAMFAEMGNMEFCKIIGHPKI